MNLTWHIVKKDFRRLSVPLLLWTLLLVAESVLCMRLFSQQAGSPEWIDWQAGIITVMVGVGWLFTFILAAAFVLEDSLVGTQMFWVTRPISGGRLLGAKALSVLLALVVWPVIVMLPSWIYLGLGGADLPAAAERIVIVQAAIVVVAGALAAVAGQGSRFLFWLLALLVAVPLAIGVVSYHTRTEISADVRNTRLFLMVAVLVATALTVIWQQFVTRRINRSLAVLATGMAMAVTLQMIWPWILVSLWPRDRRQAPGTEAIELSVSSANLQGVLATSGVLQTNLNGNVRLTLNFQAKHVPEELSFVSGGRAEADFRWADGTTLQLSSVTRVRSPWAGFGKLLRLSAPNPDAETEARLLKSGSEADEFYLRRTGKPAPKSFGETSFEAIFNMDPKWVERFQAEIPACTLRLRVLTSHPRVAVEVPLREGVDRIGRGARMRVIRYGDEYRAKPGQRGQKNLYVLVSHPAVDENLEFRTVDRVHGKESWVYSGGGPGILLTAGLLPVRIDWQFVGIPYPRAWRTDKWVDMPEWFQGYTLDLITSNPDGGFDRELRLDHLPLKP